MGESAAPDELTGLMPLRAPEPVAAIMRTTTTSTEARSQAKSRDGIRSSFRCGRGCVGRAAYSDAHRSSLKTVAAIVVAAGGMAPDGLRKADVTILKRLCRRNRTGAPGQSWGVNGIVGRLVAGHARSSGGRGTEVGAVELADWPPDRSELAVEPAHVRFSRDLPESVRA
jgi:hypothetical protein